MKTERKDKIKSNFSTKEIIGISACFFFMFAMIIGQLVYQLIKRNSVKSFESAGVAISAEVVKKPLGAKQTRIVTSTGTYFVKEIAVLITGNEMIVEHRYNGESALCDKQTQKCVWLIRP